MKTERWDNHTKLKDFRPAFITQHSFDLSTGVWPSSTIQEQNMMSALPPHAGRHPSFWLTTKNTIIVWTCGAWAPCLRPWFSVNNLSSTEVVTQTYSSEFLRYLARTLCSSTWINIRSNCILKLTISLANLRRSPG